jgi:two-component system chemotaxis response regulator CheB
MKEPSRLFGTSDGDEPDATMIGCPACAGVLALVREDSSYRFVCSVGHRFSYESLLEAKEDELETTLWSSVALLAHLDMVIQKLLEPQEVGEQGRSETLRTRISQARQHSDQLRMMIEETRRPNLSLLIH